MVLRRGFGVAAVLATNLTLHGLNPVGAVGAPRLSRSDLVRSTLVRSTLSRSDLPSATSAVLELLPHSPEPGGSPGVTPCFR
jgi:hypothetical protein